MTNKILALAIASMLALLALPLLPMLTTKVRARITLLCLSRIAIRRQ
jgi:hypothetical protein